jgi:plastocyanin domain-containing protein
VKYRLAIIAPLLAVSTLFACTRNSTPIADGNVVAITATEDGFVPNHVAVKRGQKATLRFTRTTDKTCATTVVFPELKLERALPLNQAVDIEVPADKPGTLGFQCGMGMYKSTVVVQ